MYARSKCSYMYFVYVILLQGYEFDHLEAAAYVHVTLMK